MISFTVEKIEYRFFNHLYAVSYCGKVLRKMQPFVPYQRKDGYLSCGRGNNLMHRMVAICWLEKPHNAVLVHHINHNKADNRADNLEWLTSKEHVADRHAGIAGTYIRTEATRDKIRQARLGSITSEETKAKQRAALIGKKRIFTHRVAHTQAWKDNASLNHHNNMSCTVFGITYRSFAEAALATGEHRFTLRKRCLSKNFPDYVIGTP
jgi:hypothetical protein